MAFVGLKYTGEACSRKSKKYENESHWFQAFPEKISYEIITDPTTAVVALKGEKIDAIYRVEPRAFVEELQKSESFTSIKREPR